MAENYSRTANEIEFTFTMRYGCFHHFVEHHNPDCGRVVRLRIDTFGCRLLSLSLSHSWMCSCLCQFCIRILWIALYYFIYCRQSTTNNAIAENRIVFSFFRLCSGLTTSTTHLLFGPKIPQWIGTVCGVVDKQKYNFCHAKPFGMELAHNSIGQHIKLPPGKNKLLIVCSDFYWHLVLIVAALNRPFELSSVLHLFSALPRIVRLISAALNCAHHHFVVFSILEINSVC